MNSTEIEAALVRLETLSGAGPGDNPLARRELQRIVAQLSHLPGGNGYTHEKVMVVSELLDAWLRPRKWMNWGPDPATLRALIGNSISKLRMALLRIARLDDSADSDETR